MEDYTKDQKILGESIYRAVEDIYSNEAHFLYELLQNADDATPQSQKKHLLFYVLDHPLIGSSQHGELIILNNEKGFSEEDYESISTFNSSSHYYNTEQKYQTGEKGIGFKSVFTMTSTPFIFSRGKHFYFDINIEREDIRELRYLRGLAMVRPLKAENHKEYCAILNGLGNILRKKNIEGFGSHQFGADDPGSAMIFPFRDAEKRKKVIEALKTEISTRDMIFLRTTTSIEIDLPNMKKTLERNIVNKVNHSEITIQEDKLVSKWLITSTFIDNSSYRREDRRHISKLKLSIALPLSEDHLLKNIEIGVFYANLPTLEKTHLPFLIHGDFEVPASRESISNVDNNKRILKFVSHLYLNILEKYTEAVYKGQKKSPEKRLKTILAALRFPAHAHEFLKSSIDEIFKSIRNSCIFRDNQGKLIPLNEGILAPPDVVDVMGVQIKNFFQKTVYKYLSSPHDSLKNLKAQIQHFDSTHCFSFMKSHSKFKKNIFGKLFDILQKYQSSELEEYLKSRKDLLNPIISYYGNKNLKKDNTVWIIPGKHEMLYFESIDCRNLWLHRMRFIDYSISSQWTKDTIQWVTSLFELMPFSEETYMQTLSKSVWSDASKVIQFQPIAMKYSFKNNLHVPIINVAVNSNGDRKAVIRSPKHSKYSALIPFFRKYSLHEVYFCENSSCEYVEYVYKVFGIQEFPDIDFMSQIFEANIQVLDPMQSVAFIKYVLHSTIYTTMPFILTANCTASHRVWIASDETFYSGNYIKLRLDNLKIIHPEVVKHLSHQDIKTLITMEYLVDLNEENWIQETSNVLSKPYNSSNIELVNHIFHWCFEKNQIPDVVRKIVIYNNELNVISDILQALNPLAFDSALHKSTHVVQNLAHLSYFKDMKYEESNWIFQKIFGINGVKLFNIDELKVIIEKLEIIEILSTVKNCIQNKEMYTQTDWNAFLSLKMLPSHNNQMHIPSELFYIKSNNLFDLKSLPIISMAVTEYLSPEYLELLGVNVYPPKDNTKQLVALLKIVSKLTSTAQIQTYKTWCNLVTSQKKISPSLKKDIQDVLYSFNSIPLTIGMVSPQQFVLSHTQFKEVYTIGSTSFGNVNHFAIKNWHNAIKHVGAVGYIKQHLEIEEFKELLQKAKDTQSNPKHATLALLSVIQVKSEIMDIPCFYLNGSWRSINSLVNISLNYLSGPKAIYYNAFKDYNIALDQFYKNLSFVFPSDLLSLPDKSKLASLPWGQVITSTLNGMVEYISKSNTDVPSEYYSLIVHIYESILLFRHLDWKEIPILLEDKRHFLMSNDINLALRSGVINLKNDSYPYVGGLNVKQQDSLFNQILKINYDNEGLVKQSWNIDSPVKFQDITREFLTPEIINSTKLRNEGIKPIFSIIAVDEITCKYEFKRKNEVSIHSEDYKKHVVLKSKYSWMPKTLEDEVIIVTNSYKPNCIPFIVNCIANDCAANTKVLIELILEKRLTVQELEEKMNREGESFIPMTREFRIQTPKKTTQTPQLKDSHHPQVSNNMSSPWPQYQPSTQSVPLPISSFESPLPSNYNKTNGYFKVCIDNEIPDYARLDSIEAERLVYDFLRKSLTKCNFSVKWLNAEKEQGSDDIHVLRLKDNRLYKIEVKSTRSKTPIIPISDRQFELLLNEPYYFIIVVHRKQILKLLSAKSKRHLVAQSYENKKAAILGSFYS